MLTTTKNCEGNVIFLDFFKLHKLLSIRHSPVKNKVGRGGVVLLPHHPPPPSKSKYEAKIPRWKYD